MPSHKLEIMATYKKRGYKPKTQKEKEALNFNDKKKFEEFLKRQKQQEQLMKNPQTCLE